MCQFSPQTTGCSTCTIHDSCGPAGSRLSSSSNIGLREQQQQEGILLDAPEQDQMEGAATEQNAVCQHQHTAVRLSLSCAAAATTGSGTSRPLQVQALPTCSRKRRKRWRPVERCCCGCCC